MFQKLRKIARNYKIAERKINTFVRKTERVARKIPGVNNSSFMKIFVSYKKVIAFVIAVTCAAWYFNDKVSTIETSTDNYTTSVQGNVLDALDPASIGMTILENMFGSTESYSPIADYGDFYYTDVPEYSGTPYYIVNGNHPFFDIDELTSSAFEKYGNLDILGRCTAAFCCFGPETMPGPEVERESLSSVTPSGWEQAKYDIVEAGYLYNRCHISGFQLSGEQANPLVLLTGTRYFNIEGMLPFENMIADYIEETGNHVLYRATPIFKGNELVCRGLLMEAYSVEDAGEAIEFCVFIYNVQPGIEIDYTTGESVYVG